jgi:transcriptional repressor of dcmA and dcmR
VGEPLIRRAAGNLNELLDIAQAAAFLNVSETSLRRWTNTGQLRCLRVGRRRERRFRREDLLAFLEDQPSGDGALPADRASNMASLRSGFLTVTLGSHLCGLYSSDFGRVSLAVAFLLDGLNEGSVCFLVTSPRTRAQILGALEKKRPSLRTDIETERLIPSTHCTTGRAQLRYFRVRMDRWASEGVESFRVYGDMWAMRSKVSAQALVNFESAYDRAIAKNYPVASMCSYDARKFAGIEVLNALKGHRDTFRYPLEKTLA